LRSFLPAESCCPNVHKTPKLKNVVHKVFFKFEGARCEYDFRLFTFFLSVEMSFALAFEKVNSESFLNFVVLFNS
jgi:hypothetical protein